MKNFGFSQISALAIFFFSISVFADISALRAPDEDWTEAELRYEAEPTIHRPEMYNLQRSAQSSAVPYSPSIDTSAIPEWNGTWGELQTAFKRLRDDRIYVEPKRPNFKRRATWLYPDDGCFYRAAHAAQNVGRTHKIRPGKVFAFGNLRHRTDFAANRIVYWWFHVAAAVRFNHETYVLDPAVNPSKPLTLHEWVSTITRDPSTAKVSACDTFAYQPSQTCVGGSAKQERNFQYHVKRFLPLEWNRLMSMGENPERLLGKEPPWRHLPH